jgi:hypothetical protein
MPTAAGAHVQEKKTSPARTSSYLRLASPTTKHIRSKPRTPAEDSRSL